MKKFNIKYLFIIGFIKLLFLTMSGCSLFLGNISSVEEKSKDYTILNLEKYNSKWIRKLQENNSDHSQSDSIFEFSEDSSIISINSVCKSSSKNSKSVEQKKLTEELLLGFSEIQLHDQRKVSVSNLTALETTIRGKMEGASVMTRTVVLNHQSCIYDLIYIAKPEVFQKHEQDFSKFVFSLRIK